MGPSSVGWLGWPASRWARWLLDLVVGAGRCLSRNIARLEARLSVKRVGKPSHWLAPGIARGRFAGGGSGRDAGWPGGWLVGNHPGVHRPVSGCRMGNRRGTVSPSLATAWAGERIWASGGGWQPVRLAGSRLAGWWCTGDLAAQGAASLASRCPEYTERPGHALIGGALGGGLGGAVSGSLLICSPALRPGRLNSEEPAGL
jgi:hypothetical protein